MIIKKVLSRIFFSIIAVFSSQSHADIFAQSGYGPGQDGVLLLTERCPADRTGKLQIAVARTGGTVREGCYVMNARNNPVVVWQDGVIQELDGTLFNIKSSQAIVKKEVRPSPATSLTIDIKNEINLNDGTFLAKEHGRQGYYAFITHSHGRFEGGDIAKAICSDGFLVSNLPVNFAKIKKALKSTDYVLTKCSEAN